MQSKDAGEGSRVSLLVEEGSLMSEQVESSAKSDRQSHRQPPNEINYDGRSRCKHKHHSHERRRDNCDSDLHQHDNDTDSYRRRRSTLDERKRCH